MVPANASTVQRRTYYKGIGYLGDAGAAGALLGASSLASMGISAGVGLAADAVMSLMASAQQSHMEMSAATSIVNRLEPLLRANKDAYLAGPRTCVDQYAALLAFDTAMDWLQSPNGCGNPQLGAPGQRCINDRLAGGKWPWPSYYRDPIANDRPVDAPCSFNTGTDATYTQILSNLTGGPNMTAVNTQTQQAQQATQSTTAAATQAASTVGAALGGLGQVPLVVWVALGLGVLLLSK